jgi:RNA polymerase sigma factor (TIGR02999 family)
MDGPPSDTVTQLLLEVSHGNEAAREEILPLVYSELRRVALGYMNRERPDHTLQPTALVHEAYLRLIDQQRVDWRNRAQFVGLAAVMMRRILVNHARDRIAAKRGGDATRVSLTLAADAFPHPDLDVMALHEALERLTQLDLRKGQIVELKFFGGLTAAEVAAVLNISVATVEREWSFARAWLYEALSPRE